MIKMTQLMSKKRNGFFEVLTQTELDKPLSAEISRKQKLSTRHECFSNPGKLFNKPAILPKQNVSLEINDINEFSSVRNGTFPDDYGQADYLHPHTATHPHQDPSRISENDFVYPIYLSPWFHVVISSLN